MQYLVYLKILVTYVWITFVFRSAQSSINVSFIYSINTFITYSFPVLAALTEASHTQLGSSGIS